MTDVTIVVATYNRPDMLRVQLLSMLTSAAMVPKTKTRILVVDDASKTMAAQKVASDLDVDYLRLRENRGVAGALVAGFEQVDSPYYALWGDDDAFLPRWFPLHLAKMAEGFDVVAGSYWKANSELRPWKEIVLPPARMADLVRGKVTCNDGSLVRRSSLKDITFRPERERAMMMTFWLAMAAGKRRFGVVEEPTWLYRRHAGQLSEKKPSPHDMELREAATAEYAANPAWVEAFG